MKFYDPRSSQEEIEREEDEDEETKTLNWNLEVLADVFPDITPSALHDMLSNVSAESRMEIVADAALRGGLSKYSTPPGQQDAEAEKDKEIALEEEKFKTPQYQKAVKAVCYSEFKSLKPRHIRQVLKENHLSYRRARPVLLKMDAPRPRWMFLRSSKTVNADSHPYIITLANGNLAVRCTGSAVLDRELYTLFVQPVMTQRRRVQEARDRAYARLLNASEAAAADSLYECECCYDSVPFEDITFCSAKEQCHTLCSTCVQRTVHEAVYGQGWARTADVNHGTVKCFAPSASECHGIISADQVCQALCSTGANSAADWTTFSSRCAEASIRESRLAVHNCPFCSYAEAEYEPSSPVWPVLRFFFYLAMHVFLGMTEFKTAEMLRSSLRRIRLKRHGLKFHCQAPGCGITSCLRCSAQWRDPHVCFEAKLTSLRTAVEDSATDVVKRTCLSCGLAFVKESGCNKMKCTCGHSMCYLCRETIDDGYQHFCQHFRERGMGKCESCDKCELYGEQNVDEEVQTAVEKTQAKLHDEEPELKPRPSNVELWIDYFIEWIA
ncbi:hypothetical protein K470DRAFT_239431 [Piedraia hortae CBS 480.64]|uniref:RING-type domain-containing protein n=1 Tax=Piedraia hortae CBS 480.64 TaxID=1314780 RepID=A0A6A7CC05_9PEZI|nr:hypothetical protein K470DRAFT_239431 [Piedraia hortae CBS 480.64]